MSEKENCSICNEKDSQAFTTADYSGPKARWCPGCGDFSTLNSIKKLLVAEQLPPEKVVCVSGIGCSSRFPHYLSTYGFHGLHGRAFPVACGVASRRPDLHVFVTTGDGDCCAIGTGHWIHAVRYNMNMTVMLLDNSIYGLTKNQTSPTTPKKWASNTHPLGAPLSPLNPISVTLGIANASFVAQTVDWNVDHLYQTLSAAYRHRGFSFIRVVTRCPHWTGELFKPMQKQPEDNLLLMTHKKGIPVNEKTRETYTNTIEHDPSDLSEAQRIVLRTDAVPVGLFYHNPNADVYDDFSQQGLGMTPAQKKAAFEEELAKYAI